jgi:IMP dehydrogenase
MPKSSSASASSQIIMDGLTFDDLLLLPNATDFPREQADLTTQLHPTIRLALPIISSPMDTVTEADMAIAMAKAGGLGIIHRNLQIEKQAEMVSKVKKGGHLVGAAVGAGTDLAERVKALVAAKVDVIVVDSGHGHSAYILDAVSFIKKNYKKQVVMAGNIATFEGAKAMIKAGADILRVGVGPGSICTTRVVTGMGVPQMTALFEVARAVKETRSTGSGQAKVTFVADGGIRQMGDMAKALATGASAVMLGSMLAGYTQSPGEEVKRDGKQFKKYRGMGSVGAMQKGGAERYGQSMKTEAKKLIAEGVEGLVPFKGDVHDFLYQAGGALRSSFYYLGSKNLKEFQSKARFVRITQASLQESHPHTVSILDAGGTYMA